MNYNLPPPFNGSNIPDYPHLRAVRYFYETTNGQIALLYEISIAGVLESS